MNEAFPSSKFFKTKMFWFSILLPIMIRIPSSVLAPTGQDAFIVYWSIQQLSISNIKKIVIHPASIFGLYPFSGYPLGGLLLIRLLYLIYPSIYFVFAAYSIICSILASLSSFKLAKKINFSNFESYLLSIIYSTIPVFVNYTYFSLSLRGLFFAIMPFYAITMISIIQNRNKKINWVNFVFLNLLLNLIHRSGMVIIFNSFIFLVYLRIFPIFNNLEPRIKNIILKYIVPIIGFVEIYISTFIILLNPRELDNPWIPIEPGIFGTFAVVLDIALRINPILFGFCILGYKQIYSKYVLKGNDKNIEVILSFNFQIFTSLIFSAQSLYYTNITAIYFVVLAGFYLFDNNLSKSLNVKRIFAILIGIYLIVTIITYEQLYTFLVLKTYLLLFTILNLGWIGFIIFPKYKYFKKWNWDRVFQICIIVNLIALSAFYVDVNVRINDSEFPYTYLTDEEITMSSFLTEYVSDHNLEPGRILTSHTKLSQHIQALTGFNSYFDPSGLTFLLTGLIDKKSMENNVRLKPPWAWNTEYIFDYEGEYYENSTINENFSRGNVIDYRDISKYILLHGYSDPISQYILAQEETKFVITLHSNIFETEYNESQSLFIEEIQQNSEIAINLFATERLILWLLT